MLEALIAEKLQIAKEEAMYQLEDVYTEVIDVFTPTSVRECINKANVLQGYMKELMQIQVQLDVSDNTLSDEVFAMFADRLRLYQQATVEISSKYSDKIDRIKEEKLRAIEEENARIKAEFDEANRVYVELEEKRQSLLQYSDDVISTASKFGVTTQDITISNESFTIEELNSLYDDYSTYMLTSNEKLNVVTWLKGKVPSTEGRGLVLLGVFVLAVTPVLDLLAVWFFITIVMAQLKYQSHVKKHLVLMGLMFNVKPLEKGFNGGEPAIQLVDPDEYSDEEIESVGDEWVAELEVKDAENPEEELQEIMNKISLNSNKTKQRAMEVLEQVSKKKNEVGMEIKKKMEENEALKAKMLSELKRLGDEHTTSPLFKTSFIVGVDDVGVEQSVEVGLKNIIISPIANPVERQNFLSLLVANAMCGVNFGNLQITCYDPNNMNRDIINLRRPAIADIFKTESEELTKIVTRLSGIANENMKEIRNKNIIEFNKKCEETGRKPIPYNLLLVLSQPKKVEEDEALREFMRYSAQYGVFVWIVTDKQFDNTHRFNKPFEGAQFPYPMEDYDAFCDKITDCVARSKGSTKRSALMWDVFNKVICPDEKEWTYVCDEFIDLDAGFYKGDPSVPTGYNVGNTGNVHSIIAGGTGSGKSVLINNIIANATKKHSPKELELWLVDFKGSEFNFYMASEEYPYSLPHIKACLCTSDGDFAGSLYTALRKEAERRYSLLMENNCKNMLSYNQMLRNSGRESEILPRILCINDEFQVIFEKADTKIVEEINKDITYISKVARACGVHLMFASQSMKKTISGDILDQFTLRLILRCSEDVSTTLLGSKLSSEIVETNGWLYIKSSGDKETRLYRTPFIPDNMLRGHIRSMHERAIKENVPKKRLISYLESTEHDISELDSVYAKEPEKGAFDGAVFFGNSMVYKENAAPENYVFGASNNSHLFTVFPDQTDMIYFFRTLKKNISHHSKSMVFYNTQIDDLHYVLELDKECPENLQSYSKSTCSIYKIYEIINELYMARFTNSSAPRYPVYVMLAGWDKAMGFGIEKDSQFTGLLATLMQLCGEMNIHFIFLCTSIGAIPGSIISACNAKASGRVDEGDSYKLFDSKIASKLFDMKRGYMYINTGELTTRAKIYVAGDTREVKKSEIVIK